jgi:hypothetical protein
VRTEIAKPSILRPLAVLVFLAVLALLAAFAVPLAAADHGAQLWVSPAQPYDNESVRVHYQVTLGSPCYFSNGLHRRGNSFDLELGSCPILPPPGPAVVRIEDGIGSLAPGAYRLRYLFEGVEIATHEFTVGHALGSCRPDVDVLCLGDRRFEVQATWEADGQAGKGQAGEVRRDTGRLSFFSPGNVELVVKVLDACALDGRFWVFAGGLTNLRVTLTVTDTTTGAVRTYENPAGTAFKPIQDTAAFACPSGPPPG